MTDLGDDDFLWDCALGKSLDNRIFIVPDYEDDMRHFCVDNFKNVDSETFSIPINDEVTSLFNETPVRISIIESRGDGVLDIIGGELWEGALLLCSYMLQNPDAFLHSEVLELGSGVGLPGLLLAKLKSNSASPGKITLTDNDPRVIENLNAAIKIQFSEALPIWVDHSLVGCDKNILSLSTRLLDWSVFTSESRDAIGSSSVSELICEISRECELIMGCELCYAPYHARCLANLLKYYWETGSCKKVVICQMRDREGFAELLYNLQKMGIPHRLEEVSEELYATAQFITSTTTSTTTSTAAASASNSNSLSRSEYWCSSCSDTSNSASNKICARQQEQHLQQQEKQHKLQNQLQRATVQSGTAKHYTFPACMWSKDANVKHTPCKKGLLHSPREDFVFLFIGC